MTETERAAILGQVAAAMNVLEGLRESLEAAPDPATCEHPEEQRKYGGVMGQAFFTCGVCGDNVSVPTGPTPQGA